MISEFSLFLFTTLGGLAAGAYATAAVFPLGKDRVKPWILPVVSVALLAIGAIALMLHLGRLDHIFYAFSNPGSGITQEAFAAIAFGVFVAIDLLFALLKKETPRWVYIVAGILGVVLVIVMGNAYFMMNGSAAWAAWPTFGLFAIGSISAGIAFVGFLDSDLYDAKFEISSVVVHALFALSLVAVAVHFNSVGENIIAFAVTAVIAVCGAVVTKIVKSKKTRGWLVFSLIGVALIISRYAFYAACVIG